MTDLGFNFLDPPTPDEEVKRVLSVLATRDFKVDSIEASAVDLKEEAGRREGHRVLPGVPESDIVARQLAGEAACMANTRGGGALIVGVADKTGELVGAVSNVDWLRLRIHQLTEGKVTTIIRQVEVAGVRLLVITVPQAVEPVPFNGRFRHRVGKSCSPVSSTELLQGLFAGAAADPSHQRSGVLTSTLSSLAIDSLRRRLLLVDQVKAGLNIDDLLGRLGLLHAQGGFLNLAGEILLARRSIPALDYTYREFPGGPSRVRISESGLSLLEELELVETEADRHNPTVELVVGFGVARVKAIPTRALREAILNGVCHREWATSEPTVVEHIGNELRVTSPGGFIGDVTVENIITHPSRPRYRTLMNAVRQLGMVEQEGVGVDRMVADLIRIGSASPLIEVTDQPAVRIVLSGRPVNETWYRFFGDMEPAGALDDVDAALILWRLSRPESPFVTGESCRGLLQRTKADAENAIRRVANYRTGKGVLLLKVLSTPADSAPAWVLASEVRDELKLSVAGDQAGLAWVRERGRISSSEYRELVGVTNPTAVSHVKLIALSEGLEPSRVSGRGPGFHYRYTDRKVVGPG